MSAPGAAAAVAERTRCAGKQKLRFGKSAWPYCKGSASMLSTIEQKVVTVKGGLHNNLLSSIF